MTHSAEAVLASATQHGMWIGEQLGAGPAYRMPLALWLDGELDVAALRAACGDVIDRHPVLSTTVAPAGPELRLAPAARPSVTVTHVSGPRAAEQLIRDETHAGFDLRTGPLARFTIAALERAVADGAPRRHLLLVVAHHLVFDGMSTHILVRDLARFYAARITSPGAEVAGEPRSPETLSPEALSFPVAVAAEQARAAAARPAAREFWARRWSEPSPTVFPGPLRPAGQFGAGIGIGAGIDPELGRDVAEAARAIGATAFEVLVAAAHVLLFRYGAQVPAVAIDMTTRPAAARDHIGPFVNELPVLSRPAPGHRFRDFTLAI